MGKDAAREHSTGWTAGKVLILLLLVLVEANVASVELDVGRFDAAMVGLAILVLALADGGATLIRRSSSNRYEFAIFGVLILATTFVVIHLIQNGGMVLWPSFLSLGAHRYTRITGNKTMVLLSLVACVCPTALQRFVPDWRRRFAVGIVIIVLAASSVLYLRLCEGLVLATLGCLTVVLLAVGRPSRSPSVTVLELSFIAVVLFCSFVLSLEQPRWMQVGAPRLEGFRDEGAFWIVWPDPAGANSQKGVPCRGVVCTEAGKLHRPLNCAGVACRYLEGSVVPSRMKDDLGQFPSVAPNGQQWLGNYSVASHLDVEWSGPFGWQTTAVENWSHRLPSATGWLADGSVVLQVEKGPVHAILRLPHPGVQPVELDKTEGCGSLDGPFVSPRGLSFAWKHVDTDGTASAEIRVYDGTQFVRRRLGLANDSMLGVTDEGGLVVRNGGTCSFLSLRSDRRTLAESSPAATFYAAPSGDRLAVVDIGRAAGLVLLRVLKMRSDGDVIEERRHEMQDRWRLAGISAAGTVVVYDVEDKGTVAVVGPDGPPAIPWYDHWFPASWRRGPYSPVDHTYFNVFMD